MLSEVLASGNHELDCPLCVGLHLGLGRQDGIQGSELTATRPNTTLELFHVVEVPVRVLHPDLANLADRIERERTNEATLCCGVSRNKFD